MTRDEVYKLLGMPLSKDLDGRDQVWESWTASRDGSYRQRELVFENDRVVEIISGVWID
jgi:hypothetical protein